MTLQLEQQLYQEPCYIEPTVRKTDIELSPATDAVIIGFWIVLGLIGLAIISILKMPLMGAFFIGIPTFALMVLKPTLALFVFMLVLPTGGGFAYQEMFSLTKGVGLALTVSFLLNIMLTRPRLYWRNKTILAAGLFLLWITFCSFTYPHRWLELSTRALTTLQLFGLMLIAFWIIRSNGTRSLIWVLRGYVIGSMATNIGTMLTGKAMESITYGAQTRYTATLGQTVGANLLAAITGAAFFAAVYLFIRDRSLLWRLFHLSAMLFLPLIMLKIGSRSNLLALGVAFVVASTLSNIVRKHPKLFLGFILVFIIAGAAAFFFIKKGGLQQQEQVTERLTDIEYARQSFNYRLFLVKKAIRAALSYPLGTGYWSFFDRVNWYQWPHSGLFHIMGVYGIPGLIIFLSMLFFTFRIITRMVSGPEKLFSLALFTFLVVASQANVLSFKKIYWLSIGIIMACEGISQIYAQSEQENYFDGWDNNYTENGYLYEGY